MATRGTKRDNTCGIVFSDTLRAGAAAPRLAALSATRRRYDCTSFLLSAALNQFQWFLSTSGGRAEPRRGTVKPLSGSASGRGPGTGRVRGRPTPRFGGAGSGGATAGPGTSWFAAAGCSGSPPISPGGRISIGDTVGSTGRSPGAGASLPSPSTLSAAVLDISRGGKIGSADNARGGTPSSASARLTLS